ncbi:hypothetical protein RUND412_007686 [Rhizina undulata]
MHPKSKLENLPVEMLDAIIGHGLTRKDIGNLRLANQYLLEKISPKHLFKEITMHLSRKNARNIANILNTKTLAPYVQSFTFDCATPGIGSDRGGFILRDFRNPLTQDYSLIEQKIKDSFVQMGFNGVLLNLPNFTSLRSLTILFPFYIRIVTWPVISLKKYLRNTVMERICDIFQNPDSFPMLEELKISRIVTREEYCIPVIPRLKRLIISTSTNFFGDHPLSGTNSSCEIRKSIIVPITKSWGKWLDLSLKLEIFEYWSEDQVHFGYWPAVDWAVIHQPRLRRLLLGHILIGGPEFEVFLIRHAATLKELTLIRPRIVVRDQNKKIFGRTWQLLFNNLRINLGELVFVDIYGYDYIAQSGGMFENPFRDDENNEWISRRLTPDLPPYSHLDRVGWRQLNETVQARKNCLGRL